MKKNFTLLLVAALALTTACKKSNNANCPGGVCITNPAADIALLASFHEANLVPSQSFNVTAGVASTITSTNGTKITFPANFFRNPDGTVLTSGAVAVEFKEITNKIDFLLGNKGTVSNDLPLESAGTWMLKAKQGNTELRANPAAPAIVRLPRDPAIGGGMQLFNAQPAGGLAANPINWGLARPNVVDTIPGQGPTGGTGGPSFGFQLDSIGWGNADRFMTNPVYASNTKLVEATSMDMSTMRCAFVYKNRKIAWPMGSVTASGATDGHIATGQIGHFIAYGFVNGAFMAGILQNQTVTGNSQTFSVTISAQTEAAFKASLNSIL